MTFQEFCLAIDDEQVISVENAVVFSFNNSGGKVFSVSPKDIKQFLTLLLKNYSSVETAWMEFNPPNKKDYIYQYHEKSYRVIYKLFKDEDCGPIISLGGSQTKEITRLLSKLIAYLSDEKYESAEKNTLFTLEALTEALDNFDSIQRQPTANIQEDKSDIRERFKSWLIKSGQSEASAYKYSTTSINKADKILAKNKFTLIQLYDGNIKSVEEASIYLDTIDEWISANDKGGSMYKIGVSKFIEFLTESSIEAVTLQKPFLLLAGVSGTGKTRFIREQALATDHQSKNYALVPVRPDWHEPSDLLGYVSRISSKPQLIVTDVLKFIVKAWVVINDSDTTLNGITTTGPISSLDRIPPYWLCLDEMNLAPVEQYFADYLSILETRSWSYTEDNFIYECQPIIKPDVLEEFATGDTTDSLRKNLGIGTAVYDGLWKHFCDNGITLPLNLIVAGTVNMDETTHGFSRKVIDRALSIDFGEFYPNDFEHFFEPTIRNTVFTYSRHSDGRSLPQLSDTIDKDGKRSIEFLKAVNHPLLGSPFQLAYRALNELLVAVIAAQPHTEKELQAIWDDLIMTKVLPRIEGDDDKLKVLNKMTSDVNENVLTALQTILGERLNEIWETSDTDVEGTRPDLHRKLVTANKNDDDTCWIPCRSRIKLAWMQNRLESATFTSFWP